MTDTLPLDAPLPGDALTHGAGAPLSYRAYAVFSLPWFKRRTLWFGLGVLLFALMSGVGTGVMMRSAGIGLAVGSYTFGCFFLMVVAGPGLATIVRHRRWPKRVERVLVVVVILLGGVIGYFADDWASPRIEALVKPMVEAERARNPAAHDTERFKHPAVQGFGILVAASIYLGLGGVLSLRAYLSEGTRLHDSERRRELDRLRVEARHSELRFAALQAQVEPHFLFNSLAALRSLVGTDPERATRMIDALVAYLRAAIPKMRDDGDGVVGTVAQQVALCEQYLTVMQIRMGDRLSWSTDVPAALADARFPPLLLITLVENAVKHGIERKPGRGHIAIAVREHRGQLEAAVSDDGAGLDGSLSTGVGLANIRAQLEARYGDAATLDIAQRAEGGVVARVTIPLATEAEHGS